MDAASSWVVSVTCGRNKDPGGREHVETKEGRKVGAQSCHEERTPNTAGRLRRRQKPDPAITKDTTSTNEKMQTMPQGANSGEAKLSVKEAARVLAVILWSILDLAPWRASSVWGQETLAKIQLQTKTSKSKCLRLMQSFISCS